MNPTICWPDKTFPVEIHCAPGVLTGLEMIAVDGLLAMPRTGLGVGGLLLGRRARERIEILRSVEISCSHALGPAFVLTPEEISASSKLPEPDQAGDGADHDVVGWYCSKTQGPMALTAHDRAFHEAFCPERWQVALLIRPSMGNTTTAAFAFRGASEAGNTFLVGASLELSWQELAAYQTSQPALAATPERVEESTEKTRAALPVAVAPAVIPVPMARSGTLFGSADKEPEGKVRRWPLRLLIAVLLVATVSAAAFFTRSYWIPQPPVALVASSDWTGKVTFVWNREALSEEDHGTLVIEDGRGPLHTIHLDQAGVRAGWYQYDCRPGSVTATLLAGNLSDAVTIAVRPEIYLPESGISK